MMPLPHFLVAVFGLLRRQWVSLLVSALCFAMMGAVAAAFVERRISSVEERMAKEQSVTVDAFRNDMQNKIQSMTAEMMNEFVVSEPGDTVGESDTLHAYVRDVGFFVLGLFLFFGFIAFIASLFYLILFVSGDAGASDALTALPLRVFPMIGVYLWMLIRSFLWIPIVGVPLSFYFAPRLSLAPVILASGEASVRRSVALSMKRTKGMWLQIVFRFLMVSFVAFVLGWLLLTAVGVMSLFSIKIAYILWLLLLQLLLAYFTASLVVLAVTLT